MRDALAILDFPLTPDAREDLERRVCDYVALLKGLGWSPERVIVAVKRIAGESGFWMSSRSTNAEARISRHDELLADLVRWCIKEYYRSSSGSAARPEPPDGDSSS